MTDHDVTEEDLQTVRAWLDDGHGEDTPIRRVLRAYLPAPKTIAEELMDPDSYGDDVDGQYVVFDQKRMMKIVKRVEALEEMVK